MYDQGPPTLRRRSGGHSSISDDLGRASHSLAEKGDAQADLDKLDDIARRINEAARGAARDLAYAVGELVIRELYQGSLAEWSRHGTRHNSYRLLAARSDLLLSPSALCRAVGVYALCERFGGRASWPSLSVSHLQEVLALHLPEQERLLGVAEVERWTVSRLRAEIAKKRSKQNRGRPPSLAKTVRELKTYVTCRADRLRHPKSLNRIDVKTAYELREIVAALRVELESLEGALRNVVNKSTYDKSNPDGHRE